MTDRYAVWPSSLVFLFEECRRCFYLTHVEDLDRPRTPFPRVFDRIDDAMKAFFDGRDVHEMLDLPAGRLRVPTTTLVSEPVAFPDAGVELFLRGKADAIVDFEDGTHGVLDFKTTEPSRTSLDRYDRQLQAYAHALEHPTEGAPGCSPVTRLGLVCVEPEAMSIRDERYVFEAAPSWHPVEPDPESFRELLEDVAGVLGRQHPPMPGSGCGFCKYRQRAQETGL